MPGVDGSRQTWVPIVVTGNLIRVEVVANGSEPLTLLLDTGASRTILRSAAATRLGLNPPPDAPRWPSQLADGRVMGSRGHPIGALLAPRGETGPCCCARYER